MGFLAGDSMIVNLAAAPALRSIDGSVAVPIWFTFPPPGVYRTL